MLQLCLVLTITFSQRIEYRKICSVRENKITARKKPRQNGQSVLNKFVTATSFHTACLPVLKGYLKRILFFSALFLKISFLGILLKNGRCVVVPLCRSSSSRQLLLCAKKKKKKHGFILELKTKIKVSFSLNEVCTARADLDLKNP